MTKNYIGRLMIKWNDLKKLYCDNKLTIIKTHNPI